jgi:hypothetical protein
MYTSMSDDELNRISEITERNGMKETFGSGSIDHPSDLLFPVMKDPVTALRLMPILMRAWARGSK